MKYIISLLAISFILWPLASSAEEPTVEVKTSERKISITQDFEQQVLEFNNKTKDIQVVRIMRDNKSYLVVARMTADVVRLYVYTMAGELIDKKKVFTAHGDKDFSVILLEAKQKDEDTQLLQIRAIKLNEHTQPIKLLRKRYIIRPENNNPISRTNTKASNIVYPPNLSGLDNETAGLRLFNAERLAAGLLPIHYSADLNAGCALHAEYMRLNEYLGHSEDSTKPGYTEDGAQAGQDSNLNQQRNTSMPNSVEVLTTAIYHRMPMMRNNVRATGWAVSSASSQGKYYACINVWGEFSFSALTTYSNEYNTTIYNPDNHDPIPYPGVNQTHISPIFDTGEVPDPIEDFGGDFPVGYPIMLTFSKDVTVTNMSMKLYHPNGAELQGYFRAPNDPTDPYEIYQGNSVTFIPEAPLANSTTYTVRVTGKVNDEAYTKEWKFSTE